MLVFPPCLTPPEPPRLGRSDFGLAEDEFVVLFAFDLQSEMDRKNPLGLVRAFRSAFRPGDQARLVLKVTSARERPPDMRRLAEATADLPVTILETALDRGAFQDLMRACDVYASLHRSEGFGLTLAEAMSLARPVVATHYSGQPRLHEPLEQLPRALDAGHGRARRGSLSPGRAWAEPDVEAAARRFGVLRGSRRRSRRGRAGPGGRPGPRSRPAVDRLGPGQPAAAAWAEHRSTASSARGRRQPANVASKRPRTEFKSHRRWPGFEVGSGG